jgi:hypothetical protein
MPVFYLREVRHGVPEKQIPGCARNDKISRLVMKAKDSPYTNPSYRVDHLLEDGKLFKSQQKLVKKKLDL